MTKYFAAGFLFLAIVSLTSCKKNTPPVITCDPGDDVLSLPLGIVSMVYSVRSESDLDKVYIYYSINDNSLFQDTLVNCNGNFISIQYNKDFSTLANYNDEVVVKVVASNLDGSSSTLLKKIIFFKPQNPLKENQYFYSSDNTLLNSYTFINFSSVTFDSSQLSNFDIRELSEANDTLFRPDLVTRKWYSPNGGLFAKIQSPFYSVSTEDLDVLFQNSNFGNNTDLLEIGDVYVYKNNDDKYFLILIKEFFEGASGGKYIFDIRY